MPPSHPSGSHMQPPPPGMAEQARRVLGPPCSPLCTHGQHREAQMNGLGAGPGVQQNAARQRTGAVKAPGLAAELLSLPSAR